MATNSSTSAPQRSPEYLKAKKIILTSLNLVVLILSVLLIVFMSIETFDKEDFLQNHTYI